MNIFEAGIISGAPTGAVIGGVVCKSYGVFGILGGSLAGVVSGGIAGWIYGVVAIGLLSVIGGIWRGVKKRPELSEADMREMSAEVIRGIFMGAFLSLICWFGLGWLPAVLVALTFLSVYSFVAVAQNELR